MTGPHASTHPEPGAVGQPGFFRRAAAAVGRRAQSRWPTIRRTLPRDLAILLLCFLVARHVGIAWIMTDSVHASLALVIKGTKPRQGELAAFGYTGGKLLDYYSATPMTQLATTLGFRPKLEGPQPGDGFIKYMAGVPGDRVEVIDRKVYLTTNKGRIFVGVAKTHSRHGEPLAPIKSQTIPPGYVYMWAPHVDALDSRYALMGLVPAQTIVGRGIALW